MLKKLFSHTAIYGVAPQISKIAAFFSLPLITKYLTDIDFGVYGLLMAYTTALSVLSSLGLRIVIINGFYHYPAQYKWLWRQLYGFLNLWNIFYALILGILIYYVVPTEAIEHRWILVFLTVLPLVFFGQTAVLGLTYYQLNQKPLQVAWRSALFGVLTVLLNILFIVYFKMGYMGWFWSLCISGLLNNFSYWYPLNFKLDLKPIYNFKWRLIKKSLKVSFPVIPHHYSSYLVDSSDRIVMDWFKVSTGDIGKYNLAYNFGNVFNSLGTACGMAITPLVNKMYKKSDDQGAKRLIFLLQLSFFAITFFSCIWLKEIFNLMISNEALAKMYPLGIIIIMAYNYRPMYLGAVSKLFYVEKTNMLWKLTLTAGLINLILNIIFIPIYGIEAAAITTFICLIYMGYAGYFSTSFKSVNNVQYYPLIWAVSTILLTVLASLIVDLNIEYKLLITFTLIPLAVFLVLKLKLLDNEKEI
ncbi:lipopolysaccharide biosynthesis protein [Leeuwenhoekiella sp. W20_SRS_FM14]|uniref:lipopolysaccharide biosynthesis protein n=1 Tax=Leeuwenhoekiella sp. W20_SRS_FM14 TaxID=3240270 RepID=UPI003F9601E4